MSNFTQFQTALSQAGRNAQEQGRSFYVITLNNGKYRVSCTNLKSANNCKTLQVLG